MTRPTLAEVEAAARRIACSGGAVVWENPETHELEILAEAPPNPRPGPGGRQGCINIIALNAPEPKPPWLARSSAR